MRINSHNLDLTKTPCTYLKGVGDKLNEKLAKCDIFTVADLLFHLPLHYQDRTHICPIEALRVGDYAVAEGVITAIKQAKSGRGSLQIFIDDGTHTLLLRFFHFFPGQISGFAEGVRLRVFGEVRQGFQGFEMIHPEYQHVLPGKVLPVPEVLTPIYSTTQGLTQKTLRNLTNLALTLLEDAAVLPDCLPQAILQKLALPTLKEALIYLHRPPPDASLSALQGGTHPAMLRLIFEELIAHQVCLRRLRLQLKQQKAPLLLNQHPLRTSFLDRLPFQLTKAQQRVIAEMEQDLKKGEPMLRLIQGDVGSGKTVVAVLILLEAIAAGYQAALMAPTDLLAEQHFRNIETWLTPIGVRLAWLAGKHKGKIRQTALAEIENGQAQIIIGTHALFQESVKFHKLGLLVIDEQHRFGVHQRLALRSKGVLNDAVPHQVVMTATPIPRTLAMTAYADLDVSVIDELPPGRLPVKTVVVSNQKRLQVINRVLNACQSGRQVYWVCTLIEESDQLQCQAAEVLQQQLITELNQLRIGLVHGRLPASDKQTMMAAFKNQEIDVLVATTVIEVGVDVPNASVMVIENAERLGLSQLHQLRGRVGRGAQDSYCVLLYQAPLTEISSARLKVIRDTNDGFLVAKQDLALRGPGELLGTRQTGMLHFRIADLLRDQALIEQVQQTADLLLREFPEIIPTLIARWLPKGDTYAQV